MRIAPFVVVPAQDADQIAVDDKMARLAPHAAVPFPVYRVVLQEIREVVLGNQVVDPDQLEVFRLVGDDLKGGPAYSTQSVDGDFFHERASSLPRIDR
jgi:hypothetical protein